MRTLRLLTLLAILFPFDVLAQEKVGSSQVNGETVDLFSDHTWSYRSNKDDCVDIKSGILFCGAGTGWNKSRSTNSEAAAQFRYDDRLYGLVIVEEVGVNDGMSLEFMKSAVVEHLATATNVSADDIPVLEVVDGNVNGLPSSLVVYAGKMQDLAVVYANTIVSQPLRTTQLVTYSIGREFSERHRNLHREFVGAAKINR